MRGECSHDRSGSSEPMRIRTDPLAYHVRIPGPQLQGVRGRCVERRETAGATPSSRFHCSSLPGFEVRGHPGKSCARPFLCEHRSAILVRVCDFEVRSTSRVCVPMAKSAAHRLKIELKRFNDDPTPLFLARPIESNVMEWRFVMAGAPGTPYHGGMYHGKLVFPTEYPWKPPSIYMITPSGRFKTNTRICLSISDFHPGYRNLRRIGAFYLPAIFTDLLHTSSPPLPVPRDVVPQLDRQYDSHRHHKLLQL